MNYFSKSGNSRMLYEIEFSNACAHKPTPRRDDGQQALTWQQTVMRQAYAETAARGVVGWVASELPVANRYFSNYPPPNPASKISK
jgi:uncharacterized protein YhjY with autotransporter beta-barrel domain